MFRIIIRGFYADVMSVPRVIEIILSADPRNRHGLNCWHPRWLLCKSFDERKKNATLRLFRYKCYVWFLWL